MEMERDIGICSPGVLLLLGCRYAAGLVVCTGASLTVVGRDCRRITNCIIRSREVSAYEGVGVSEETRRAKGIRKP